MLKSEARFTPPRPDCPHPERWHSADDDSAEEEVSELIGGLVRALQPDFVVETGTAWGYTAEWIGTALRDNGHGELLTCETDGERVVAAKTLCADLPVTVVQTTSRELLTAEWLTPASVGFAWLDSLLPLRAGEFEALKPFLTPGAIVGFHDAGPQHGMRDTWEALPNLRPIYLPTPRGLLLCEYRA